MPDTARIKLSIDVDRLTSFCDKLQTRSRDPARLHDELVTLETFIKHFAMDSDSSEAYRQILAYLEQQTQTSREALLQKNAEDLKLAMQHLDLRGIAAVHTPLSRNGFYTILQQVIEQLTDEELAVLMEWSGNWIRQSRQLAQQASGYPDAMDFMGAGINIEEYHAMNDLNRVLNGD